MLSGDESARHGARTPQRRSRTPAGFAHGTRHRRRAPAFLLVPALAHLVERVRLGPLAVRLKALGGAVPVDPEGVKRSCEEEL